MLTSIEASSKLAKLESLPCDKNSIVPKPFAVVRLESANHYAFCWHVFIGNVQRSFDFVLEAEHFCINYSLYCVPVLFQICFVF